MAFKRPLQLWETRSLLKYIEIIVQSLCQITQNHGKGRKHTVKVKKVCYKEPLVTFCQNHVSCLLAKNYNDPDLKPCSLALICQMLELSITFCCLQSNLWCF